MIPQLKLHIDATTSVSYSNAVDIRCDYIGVEVENGGDNDLTSFGVQLRDGDGAWFDYLLDSDFASASDSLPWCSTTVPDTLAVAATSNFRVHVTGHAHIRFRATSAGVSRIEIRGQMS